MLRNPAPHKPQCGHPRLPARRDCRPPEDRLSASPFKPARRSVRYASPSFSPRGPPDRRLSGLATSRGEFRWVSRIMKTGSSKGSAYPYRRSGEADSPWALIERHSITAMVRPCGWRGKLLHAAKAPGSRRQFRCESSAFTGNAACLREFRGGILQAPWPYNALQPTPWTAVACPSLRGRRG